MRERLRLVNGTLDIESAPGRGTAIVAWVPVKGDAS
jgi:signal transduction histidine kinase